MQCAQQQKLQVVMDPDLLDEVTALVEWPQALLVEFDPRFLKIPKEALISEMAEHQRCFHVLDKNNHLAPYFITVSNIASSNSETVVQGNRRVMQARFSDAEFFYEADKKIKLETRLATLEQVIYQKQLGSVKQKAERISQLAQWLATELKTDRQNRNSSRVTG